jgi:transposase
VTTTDDLVPDTLWQAIEPLLPTPPRRYGGRPRIDDRAALAGIVYQQRTGVPWRLLPVGELGCGSPVTCWRRLRDWQRTGVWQQLHHRLLDQLGRASQLDWSRASLDSISVRAKRGLPDRANPTDRGKPGSKYHLLVARRGIESSARLGRHRYVVARSLAWLLGHRRLQVRDERRADLLLGFLHLACALICRNALNQPKG